MHDKNVYTRKISMQLIIHSITTNYMQCNKQENFVCLFLSPISFYFYEIYHCFISTEWSKTGQKHFDMELDCVEISIRAFLKRTFNFKTRYLTHDFDEAAHYPTTSLSYYLINIVRFSAFAEWQPIRLLTFFQGPFLQLHLIWENIFSFHMCCLPS